MKEIPNDVKRLHKPPADDEIKEALELLNGEEPDLSHLDVKHARDDWHLVLVADKEEAKELPSMLLKTDTGYFDLMNNSSIPENDVMTISYAEELKKSHGIELPELVSFNQIALLVSSRRNPRK